MKKLLITLCLTPTLLFSQNAQFSQFFTTGVNLNPALAGIQPTAALNLNYKRFAESTDGSFIELMHGSVIYPFQKTTSITNQVGGVALTVVREKAGFKGVLQTMDILATGSYVATLDSRGMSQLAFGLQAGVVQNKVNTSELRFGSQYDPTSGFNASLPGELVEGAPTLHPVVNFGTVLTFTDHQNPLLRQNSLIVGFSANNINRPKTGFIENSEDGEAITYQLFGTAKLATGKTFYAHPSALVIQSQGSLQINAGMYLSKYLDKNLSVILRVGSWYRFGDSFIILGGIDYAGLKLGVSFDLNSDFINANEALVGNSFNNSYEISLAYDLNFSSKVVRAINPLF